MREPRDDVLGKMDALLRKHHTTEPEIPVLTDIVENPRIDLDVIPVLTDEVDLAAPPMTPEAPYFPEPEIAAAQTPAVPEYAAEAALPTTPIEIDLAPPPQFDEPELEPEQQTSVLQRLEAVEAEVQAEINARISQTQSTPSVKPSIEIPQGAQFIPLATLPTVPASPPVAAIPAAVESAQQLSAQLEAEVARIIKKHLHQTLDQELSGMLNRALDKATSSMLEQFIVHMEEVVRSSIADELKKQLAPFKRPTPPNKSE